MKKITSIFVFLGMVVLFSLPAQAKQVPESFADMAEKLLPSVVNISTTQKIKTTEDGKMLFPPLDGIPGFPQGSPLEDMLKDFFEMQRRYQGGGQQEFEYQRPNALGSGFIIDADKGYVVTNNHVVAGADEIKVILHDDTALDAELIGRDEKTDLAVLKVDTDISLQAIEWGDSDEMRVGDWIVAIGNPFGLGGTVTAGIISARQRNINAGPYDDFLQTDASINKGNSGGPMFDMKGHVIGINTAIYSPSGGSVGIGFAIPSTMARSVVKQLIEYGRTRRGWLGVRIQSVTDEIAESLGLKKAMGALVASVTEDSPAKEAGIQSGDVILEFNGQDVETMNRLPRIVAETEIGKKSDVVFWRDGKKQTVAVKVGELEKAEEEAQHEKEEDIAEQEEAEEVLTEIKELGLFLSSLDDQTRSDFGIDPTVNGVLVGDVQPGSPASRKQILAGDVIVEFNQTEVTKPAQIKDLFETAKKEDKKTVLLLVNQGGSLRFVALKLKEK